MFSAPEINSKDVSKIILYIIPIDGEYVPQLEVELAEKDSGDINIIKAMAESLGWARYKFDKIIDVLENE